MPKSKLFTQINGVHETTLKRFQEISFYLLTKKLQNVENGDIVLEGLAIAANCNSGIILHAKELLNNLYYKPTNLEIAVFISYYNIPVRHCKEFDISERTYYRLLPEYIYQDEEHQQQLTKNKFGDDVLEEVVKFNEMLYNLSSPFKIYEIVKER